MDREIQGWADGQTYRGWTDGYRDTGIDRWTKRYRNGWIERQKDGWIDRQKDGQTVLRMGRTGVIVFFIICFLAKKKLTVHEYEISFIYIY